MKRRILGLIALLTSISFGACQSGKETSPILEDQSSYRVAGGKIVFHPESKFFKHLKMVEVKGAKLGSQTLLEVGQVIALSNPTGELSETRISWVELDSKLSQSLELRLDSSPQFPVGTALGLSLVSKEYAPQIKPGQPIRVSRYGLHSAKISGSVLFTRASEYPELIHVVYQIPGGQNWLPGTNCEIEFPMIKKQSVMIPTDSLLHVGSEEFVLKEVHPGEFIPKNITVIQEVENSVVVTGGLSPFDRIAGQGAILLKPELQKLLGHSGESTHVP